MATINKIKSTRLKLTETIMARALTSYVFSLFSCPFSGKSFAQAKNEEFEEKESSFTDKRLDFYMETSTRTWV
jgi:hypothetical protein